MYTAVRYICLPVADSSNVIRPLSPVKHAEEVDSNITENFFLSSEGWRFKLSNGFA